MKHCGILRWICFLWVACAPIWGAAQQDIDEAAKRKRRVDELKAKVWRAKETNAGLKVGEQAPDFKLKSLDGKTEFSLTETIRNKPVVLIFGSYS